MDGARLFNAAIAAKLRAMDFGRGCDSVWVDFSKSLGCPFGAVLAGSADFIDEAWRWKHRLGGAMRQSGLMAAACLYALDNNIERLALDHENARLFADIVRGQANIELAFDPIETNMVFINLSEAGVTSESLLDQLSMLGIRLSQEGPYLLRAVTHLDVDTADLEFAGEALVAAVKRLQIARSDEDAPDIPADSAHSRAGILSGA